MLLEAELDRICVVLVRARNPSNIGAVARAMHDFGFKWLKVVNEFPVPFEAAKSAVDASEVMAAAVMCASVAEAVADCTLVVGTTAVGERDLQQELVTLAEAAPRILAALGRYLPQHGDAGANGAPSTEPRLNPMVDDKPVEPVDCAQGRLRAPELGGWRVALLFGSEKTGLSNEELSHCNWLLTVPMFEHAHARHPSMNLGQAVAVCLYELVRESTHDGGAVMDRAPGGNPAAAGSLERITELLTEVMQETEYTRRHAHNCDPAQVRRLVRRMGTDAVDAPVWMGILKQVLWKLTGRRGE